ncbi:MAG: MogA/MoaB family molybdenum cofactor biosynthesis protein [Anaerolineales bacterium]|nr:MogA/MoaB family molybdenum cofactor biosynthesis protein [Anaerolineales bacterium]
MAQNTLRIGLLIASDRSAQGVRPDLTGPALEECIQSQGWILIRRDVQPDDAAILRETLTAWADRGDLDVILTSGGTGFSPRDVTPEATRAVIQREAPGLAEAMRQASQAVTPHAMLSRAVAGIRDRVLIVNLPGSPKAAVENLQIILPVLPHAVELLHEEPDAEKHH